MAAGTGAIIFGCHMRSNTRITSIRRLIEAADSFGESTHVMEQQTARTQARLEQGVDLDSNTFTPYKYPNKLHDNDRPLQRAARLFEGVKYNVNKALGGVDFKMTMSGEPAKIAYYQNLRRRFMGFSRSDRTDAKEELGRVLMEAFKNAR